MCLRRSPYSALSRAELEALLVELFGEIASLKLIVAELSEENTRLKGLNGRPHFKPSGMEKGTAPPKSPKQEKRPGRRKVSPRVKVEEKVIGVEVPPRAVFNGHEPILVQDLVIRALARAAPLETPQGGRFRPTDKLLAFLQAL